MVSGTFSKPSQQTTHPVLAKVVINDQSILAKFNYLHPQVDHDVKPLSDHFARLRKILTECKLICERAGIEPLLVFIPTKAHIDAPYTTEESGEWWLAVKQGQISRRGLLEQAVSEICAEIPLRCLRLTPAFENAAREGELLYYPFDTHWNSEGRQLAAEIVSSELAKISSESQQPATDKYQ